MSAGVAQTVMPAASMAAILSDALPDPPEMIAPAWPMRRPGGAVCPAMKPTTGFFTFALMYAAAVSSALPPISPIMMIACVSGSSLNSWSASMKLVPMIGIAADADAGRLADAELRELADRFVGQRARARDDADVAFLVNVPRHDADLALARRDDARAVRSDQPRLLALAETPRPAPCRAPECLR